MEPHIFSDGNLYVKTRVDLTTSKKLCAHKIHALILLLRRSYGGCLILCIGCSLSALPFAHSANGYHMIFASLFGSNAICSSERFLFVEGLLSTLA